MSSVLCELKLPPLEVWIKCRLESSPNVPWSAPSTFYGWYQRYLDGGPEAPEDRKPRPRGRWNRISQEIRQQVVDRALERTELSARKLACHFTDERRYFLSESSVYRILKAYDLITSPAFALLSTSDRFSQPTRRVNEMWQTDFTYLRVIR